MYISIFLSVVALIYLLKQIFKKNDSLKIKNDNDYMKFDSNIAKYAIMEKG